MESISLLMPPLAFAIMLVAAGCLSLALKGLSLKRKGPPHGLEPYACGEDIPSHMMQPNYGQFLPFAIFFTVLHVVALAVATVPVATTASMIMAGVYVLGAVVGLSVLYRK